MPAEGGGRDLLPGQEVLRQDADRPAHQGRGEGLVIGHPEGVVVEDLGLLHLEEVAGIGRGRLRIDRDLVGVEDIRRGEGAAVVPAHPLAQVKGDDEAVPGDLPGFGQIAHDVHILVVLDEAVEDHPGDLVGGGIGGEQRDEVRRVADGALDHDVPVGGSGSALPAGARPGACGLHAATVRVRHRVMIPMRRPRSSMVVKLSYGCDFCNPIF